ncbi:MAG: efflux RND transporter periplasmic adaptor subunit [Bacteroidales bacterium]|nr:efflux RND transporter periplasmic adaptor subunit [Bacteroidales bacterium]
MKRNFVVLILVAGISLLTTGCKEKSASTMPPPNVQVVEVIQQDIPVMEEFVGQTYGLFDISLQARVDGFLEGIYFEEGRGVKKGQLLYTIAPEPYEAKVAVAKGQLAEANTRLVKAKNDLVRIKPLAEINAVSQSDLDAAVAQRDAAIGSLDAAKANLESANIELGFTKVYSPINGIIGKTEVYPGDYVGKGISNVVLNEVSRIDTILVNFHLPEEKYLEIARFISQRDPDDIQENAPARGLTLILSDGSVYPEEGKIKFVNRQVNATTGTILLQASFPNTNMILRPGQFAKVQGVIDNIMGGLLIPQRCVQELQGNYNVFVVNENDEVEFRKIEITSTYETSYMIVSSGLEAGERVVYEGLQKVKSGMKVNPVVQDISISQSENQD